MPNPISRFSNVVAVKHQVSCDLSDEVVVLNLRDGVYYGMNAVGARIWNLVQEPKSVDEIHRSLLEEYEIDPLGCERQVEALLGELSAHGLIEIA